MTPAPSAAHTSRRFRANILWLGALFIIMLIAFVPIVVATVLALGTEGSREQGTLSAECRRHGRRRPSGLSWRI